MAISDDSPANLFSRYRQPLGLMQFLASDEKVPDKDIDRMHVRDNLKAVQLSRKKINMLESTLLHWRTKLRHKQAAAAAASLQPVTLRKRRQNIKSEANWPLFYYRWAWRGFVAGICLRYFGGGRHGRIHLWHLSDGNHDNASCFDLQWVWYRKTSGSTFFNV